MNMLQGAGWAVTVPAAAVATNGSAQMSIDTKGYDYATIRVLWGTNVDTSAARFTTLYVREHDTTTSPTSMTAIAAFAGGTATSSSVGFVIPTGASGGTGGGGITFNIDLKSRKRYLGVVATPAGASNYVCIDAVCSRPGASKDTTTLAQITNNSATNVAPITNLVIG